MHPAIRLLSPCRITLFTRANCGLCAQAKDVLAQVQARRPFLLREVDVAGPSAGRWGALYDLDVPVIHISKTSAGQEDDPGAGKLMHRFTPDEVLAKMDRAG